MVTCQEIKIDSPFWNKLVLQSKTASFFQTKDWITIWVRHFNREAKIVGVFDNGALIGIAPFEIRENEVNF